jgi:hypothetical protein
VEFAYYLLIFKNSWNFLQACFVLFRFDSYRCGSGGGGGGDDDDDIIIILIIKTLSITTNDVYYTYVCVCVCGKYCYNMFRPRLAIVS